MKLYGRRQVAAIWAATALCALVIGGLFTAFVILPRDSQSDHAARVALAPVPVLPIQFSSSSARSGGLLEDELNNIQIYDRANKAVVYVTTVTMQYTWFYQAVPQEGTGSGVIIDQQGHVLTNYHVVNGADKISITLADGTDGGGQGRRHGPGKRPCRRAVQSPGKDPDHHSVRGFLHPARRA